MKTRSEGWRLTAHDDETFANPIRMVSNEPTASDWHNDG